LVAYVVADHTEAMTAEVLRRHLGERLPSYMVPSAFVFLEALPLTVNGKLDRQALPDPALTAEMAYAAPRTSVEEVLANIWAQVLGLERVGVDDNFFALGGHSLLITQLISRVRDTFRVELPFRRMFEAPTVAGLAAAMLQGPSTRATVERTADLLLQLSRLSDAEVETMLAAKAASPKGSEAP
jgi:acyl carrier protein